MSFNHTLREWQNIYKPHNQLIVQASSMNEDDAWMPFPIGMHYKIMFNYNKNEKIQIGNHDLLVVSGMNPNTDSVRRPNGINRKYISDILTKNNIPTSFIDHSEYFESLPNYKFIVSPEGNGIDCHRHYEALIAGCIPIIEKNHLTEEKYKSCPVLWTTDYSEITKDYLEQKYKEMLDVVYDFSPLMLQTYSMEVQEQIKNCGNYWLQRHLGMKWY